MFFLVFFLTDGMQNLVFITVSSCSTCLVGRGLVMVLLLERGRKGEESKYVYITLQLSLGLAKQVFFSGSLLII